MLPWLLVKMTCCCRGDRESMICVTVGLMHGDMSQPERNEVIHAFKKKEIPVLVATDVAGEDLTFFLP